MRIGIFGGSFDPVHTGHLILAEQCRDQASLDEVWFVPSATAPHKPAGPVATARQRREMLEIALAGNPAFRVDSLELERGGVSFTVDTLRQIRERQPADELLLIIGGDSLADLGTWREPAEICRLARLLVYSRPGVSPSVKDLLAFTDADSARQVLASQIDPVLIGISSSDIRGRIRSGRSVRYLLPRGVEAYIEAAGLYRETT